jgi:hypothetical protein
MFALRILPLRPWYFKFSSRPFGGLQDHRPLACIRSLVGAGDDHCAIGWANMVSDK